MPCPVVCNECMAYLELRDVCVEYPVRSVWGGVRGVVKAVDGVSLDVEKGEVLGLVGESGCGKSTLSRAIMQLQAVTSGCIRLDGVELSKLRGRELRRKRADFQMVFQDPYASLNPRWTVYSTLAEALSVRRNVGRGDRVAAVGELMERVGLSPEWMYRYPHEFSGGQRQRVAIARAIAPEPKLLVADEPVSALDVSVRGQVLNLLRQLQVEMGLTVVLISHDLAVVYHLADRIAVMRRGRIVEIGNAESVWREPREKYTRELWEAGK